MANRRQDAAVEQALFRTPPTALQFWLKNRMPRAWGGEPAAQDGEAEGGVIELPQPMPPETES